MDDYRALAVFVAVADSGGFSQAGRELGLSTSVVSHHVGRLERKLGVSLFFRSTRAMSLTSEGQRMVEPARRMVAEAKAALDALAGTSEQPVGALRISLPAFGSGGDIYGRVWSFIRAHPLVDVTLHSSDHQVDLVKEGFDVAIRLGNLPENSLKTRRVGDFHRVLVASPRYLEQEHPIQSVDDLKRCAFISYAMIPDKFTLTHNFKKVEFSAEKIRLQVASVAAMKSAILAGLGVQRMPLSEVEREIACGDLVHLLPEWRLPVLGVFAVWPDLGPQKNLTRRFVESLL